MKKIISIAKQLTAILTVVCFMVFTSHTAGAQTKPKGKPWPAPASALTVKNPVKPDAVSLKDGKLLYIKNCKSCHGDTGKGDGAKAKNLDISSGDFSLAGFKKITDGELFWKITEGRKPMPLFNKKLSANERWSIINYIKTFAH
ncbi:MAG: c-type cytochrome [Chitinophagaceae bacterium]